MTTAPTTVRAFDLPRAVASVTPAPAVRRMHHHELPADYLSPCLPTARPVYQLINGKASKKWQAVVYHQGPASNAITLLWSSQDLHESRDEALEVAVLKAERSEVADYLGRQGVVSLPVHAGA